METKKLGLRQADMPKDFRCEHPDCKEKHADGSMFIHGRCHPNVCPFNFYEDGVVVSICGECHKKIAAFEIAVCSGLRVAVEGEMRWKTRSDMPKMRFWLRNIKCRHDDFGNVLSYSSGGKLAVHCGQCDEVSQIFEVAK